MSASVAGKLYNFCEEVSHGSFFEYGCCNGTQLDYGVDFQANWKSCVDDSKPSSLIQESMVKIQAQVYCVPSDVPKFSLCSWFLLLSGQCTLAL